MFEKDLYKDYVVKTCKDLELRLDLMLAIISVESSWNPSAIRFEPSFLYVSKPSYFAQMLRITEMTEKTLQQFSWGLGQIMGATARDCGMKSPLQSLSLPDCGSFWACVYMKRICTRYVSLTDQIAAYNAGEPRKKQDGTYQNQDYVDKVIKLIQVPDA
jgi:hypothetical protein